MKKLIFLLLTFVAQTLVLYANELTRVDFSQSERKVVLELSVENLDVSTVKYNTLDNPPRLYVDIENVSRRQLSNFVRRFDDDSMLVTGLRLWYHDSLGSKRNVYRLVMDYNEEMLKDYKVVRDEKNRVYVLLYPKEEISLASFNWNSLSLPAVVRRDVESVAKADRPERKDRKAQTSDTGTVKNLTEGYRPADSGQAADSVRYYIEDISVKGYGVSEDVVVRFNEVLPRFRINVVSDTVFLIEFEKDIRLRNEGMQRFFKKDFGFFEKVKFFEKDVERGEKSVVRVTTLMPVSKTKGVAVRRETDRIVISASSSPDTAYYFYSLNSGTHLPFENREKGKAASFFRGLIPRIVTPAVAREVLDSARHVRVINERAEVRLGPGDGYGVIGTLASGAVVETFGGRLGYYRIKYDNRDAWIRASFVSPLRQGSPPPMDAAVEQQVGVGVGRPSARQRYRVSANSLNLRSGSNMAATVVRTLKNGDELIVEGRENNWYRVVLAQDTLVRGWVSSNFVVPIVVEQQIALQHQEIQQQPVDASAENLLAERRKVTFTGTQPIDPFIPRERTNSVEGGPNVEYLALVGIIYDVYDRIALLESEDRALDRAIFTMREGDGVRNGRLHRIYEDRVVFLLTIFGVTQTHVLRMKTNDR